MLSLAIILYLSEKKAMAKGGMSPVPVHQTPPQYYTHLLPSVSSSRARQQK